MSPLEASQDVSPNETLQFPRSSTDKFNMRNRLIVAAIFSLLALSACQKGAPQILGLGSLNQGPGNGGDTGSTAAAGNQITLGSSDVVTAGGYKLKGRLSAIEPVTSGSAGGYKLRGTVKF